jgi:spore coat protein A, manganese oxidase
MLPSRNTVGAVMQFRVTLPLSSIDTSVIPSYIGSLPIIREHSASR